MRRLMLALLVLALLHLPARYARSAAPPALRDLAGHWSQSDVQQAVAQGWVSGYPDSTFQPDALISRAEFVKLLAAGLLEPLMLLQNQSADLGHKLPLEGGGERMSRLITVPNGGFESGSFFPWRDVGRVTVSTGFPRTGRYYAFFLARPFENAHIVQRIALGPPEPEGFYTFVVWAARTTFATTGTLVLSVLGSRQPPAIIPLDQIPLVQYRPFSLRVHQSALPGRSVEFRIDLNGGTMTTSVGIDDVAAIAT